MAICLALFPEASLRIGNLVLTPWQHNQQTSILKCATTVHLQPAAASSEQVSQQTRVQQEKDVQADRMNFHRDVKGSCDLVVRVSDQGHSLLVGAFDPRSWVQTLISHSPKKGPRQLPTSSMFFMWLFDPHTQMTMHPYQFDCNVLVVVQILSCRECKGRRGTHHTRHQQNPHTATSEREEERHKHRSCTQQRAAIVGTRKWTVPGI